MLDKSLPYIEIFMKRSANSPIPEFELNEEYEFCTYAMGDEKHWAAIETSAQEFDKVSKAKKYFKKTFFMYQDELKRRCFFVRHKATKEMCVTATIWWDYIGDKRCAWLHWIAVKENHQGRGLAKAIVAYCMNNAIRIEGDVDIYLHTQTWSYKAINIYRKFFFDFMTDAKIGKWDNGEFDKAYKIITPYLR